jgi:iron complex transport system permease protein
VTVRRAPAERPTAAVPATGPVAGARRPPPLRPARLRWRALVIGVLALLVAAAAGLALGPVRINPLGSLAAVLHLPAGLTPTEDAIVTQLRLPRVVLGGLVGATLALAGGAYQGIFRNPLADPYLLGVAAGAGLGATLATAVQHQLAALDTGGGTPPLVPLFAFAGALVAVVLTYLLGAAGSRYRTPATLLLAGVAVAAFLTAAQTLVQQRSVDTIREVYAWLMGRLSTAGWHDVLLLLPFAAPAAVVIVAAGRQLDLMSVGDEEVRSLGGHPERTRYALIVAASLATAAAVAVSGLIGFVGIIVPHTVRLLAGSSYRVILPLSALYGAAFLILADLAARTVVAPNEVPIGVVTALFGAPFFVVVLRTTRRGL